MYCYALLILLILIKTAQTAIVMQNLSSRSFPEYVMKKNIIITKYQTKSFPENNFIEPSLKDYFHSLGQILFFINYHLTHSKLSEIRNLNTELQNLYMYNLIIQHYHYLMQQQWYVLNKKYPDLMPLLINKKSHKKNKIFRRKIEINKYPKMKILILLSYLLLVFIFLCMIIFFVR